MVGGVSSYVECKEPVHVVAISGSLRKSSSNTALLAAAAQMAPANVTMSLFDGLANLPPFDPDLDEKDCPDAVKEFRKRLDGCDAVLISSPEYAHGVPGVLKNALDWIVGSGEFIGKPVGVLNASARSTHAWASLVETLTVMSARVIVEASILVPLQNHTREAADIASHAEFGTLLRSAVQALSNAARTPYRP